MSQNFYSFFPNYYSENQYYQNQTQNFFDENHKDPMADDLNTSDCYHKIELNESETLEENEDDDQFMENKYIRENLWNNNFFNGNEKIEMWMNYNQNFMEINQNSMITEDEEIYNSIKQKIKIMFNYILSKFYNRNDVFKILKNLLDKSDSKSTELISQRCLFFKLENSKKINRDKLNDCASDLIINLIID